MWERKPHQTRVAAPARCRPNPGFRAFGRRPAYVPVGEIDAVLPQIILMRVVAFSAGGMRLVIDIGHELNTHFRENRRYARTVSRIILTSVTTGESEDRGDRNAVPRETLDRRGSLYGCLCSRGVRGYADEPAATRLRTLYANPRRRVADGVSPNASR